MLQTRTVAPGTLGLLKVLMSFPELNQFNLVGGTCLALQFGHRMSEDLDLFTIHSFENEKLLTLLTSYEVIDKVNDPNVLMISINGIKVDFVKMNYEIFFPIIYEEGIRMLDIRDIAPMKLKAVTQRGSKKDFYDIYYLLQHMSLDEMIELFQRKFKMKEVFHVIKSLTYFKDAEIQKELILFDKSITWAKVKNEIIQKTENLSI